MVHLPELSEPGTEVLVEYAVPYLQSLQTYDRPVDPTFVVCNELFLSEVSSHFPWTVLIAPHSSGYASALGP